MHSNWTRSEWFWLEIYNNSKSKSWFLTNLRNKTWSRDIPWRRTFTKTISKLETSEKKPEVIPENDTTYRLTWRTDSGRSWGSEAVWPHQQFDGRCTGPEAAPTGSPRPTRPSERGAHGASATAITVDLLLRLRPYLSAIYLIKFFDSYEIV